MQKLDFIKNLEIIVEKLESVEILRLFNIGLKGPSAAQDFGLINPYLFTSKSNYDQIKSNKGINQILSSLSTSDIYSEGNLSNLTRVLKAGATAKDMFTNSNVIQLFNFHNALVQSLILAKNTLGQEDIEASLDNEASNGVIVFQVVIDGEGLETETYIKIFQALEQLVNTISKIVDDVESKSEIILLDSGSDSNIGIKTGIETAKSLFLIFKEVWEFVISRKLYKEKQNNQALLDSLSIRSTINEKIKDGTISEEEGKEYVHLIKTRTDDLIGLNVLPKQIAMGTNYVDNKKILSSLEGQRLISSGDN